MYTWYNFGMTLSPNPYFLWDYALSETEVRAILRGDDPHQKAWIVARLLESARYADIWQYITLPELRAIFPLLQLRPEVRAVWEFALAVWEADSREP